MNDKELALADALDNATDGIVDAVVVDQMKKQMICLREDGTAASDEKDFYDAFRKVLDWFAHPDTVVKIMQEVESFPIRENDYNYN